MLSVRVRSRSAKAPPAGNASAGACQVQLPTAVPGVFMRASEPSANRSWAGTTASRAVERNASWTSAHGMGS